MSRYDVFFFVTMSEFVKVFLKGGGGWRESVIYMFTQSLGFVYTGILYSFMYCSLTNTFFSYISGSQEDNFLHAMRDSPARYPFHHVVLPF